MAQCASLIAPYVLQISSGALQAIVEGGAERPLVPGLMLTIGRTHEHGPTIGSDYPILKARQRPGKSYNQIYACLIGARRGHREIDRRGHRRHCHGRRVQAITAIHAVRAASPAARGVQLKLSTFDNGSASDRRSVHWSRSQRKPCHANHHVRHARR
jgi:hypothetical protein